MSQKGGGVVLIPEEYNLWKALLPSACDHGQNSWSHKKKCPFKKQGVMWEHPYPAGTDEEKEVILCSCSEGKDLPQAFKQEVPEDLSQKFHRAFMSPLYPPSQTFVLGKSVKSDAAGSGGMEGLSEMLKQGLYEKFGS